MINLYKSTDIDLEKMLFERLDEIKAKLFFIKSAIHMLVSDNLNHEKIKGLVTKHLEGTSTNSTSFKISNEKLDKLAECIIVRRINMIISNTFDFLLESENYLNENFNIDLFKLLFGLRLSEYLNKTFSEKDLNFVEFDQFMMKIYFIYSLVYIRMLRPAEYFCSMSLTDDTALHDDIF